MKSWMTAIVSVLAFVSAGTAEEAVEIAGPDGFVLRGTYYAAEGTGPGALLLHQCNRARAAYEELAPEMAAAGVHVLTLDVRGFGESVDEKTTDFHSRSEELWPLFEGDVEAAMAHLLSRPGVNGEKIGLLGASCGGSQALLLANKSVSVKTVVFLSSSVPWIDDSDLEEFETKNDLPVLCVVAEEDKGTYQRSRRVFQRSRSADSRFIVYKGHAHGAPLFDQDPALVGVIVDWFAARLFQE